MHFPRAPGPSTLLLGCQMACLMLMITVVAPQTPMDIDGNKKKKGFSFPMISKNIYIVICVPTGNIYGIFCTFDHAKQGKSL